MSCLCFYFYKNCSDSNHKKSRKQFFRILFLAIVNIEYFVDIDPYLVLNIATIDIKNWSELNKNLNYSFYSVNNWFEGGGLFCVFSLSQWPRPFRWSQWTWKWPSHIMSWEQMCFEGHQNQIHLCFKFMVDPIRKRISRAILIFIHFYGY